MLVEAVSVLLCCIAAVPVRGRLFDPISKGRIVAFLIS
jgi:hypothetical protein